MSIISHNQEIRRSEIFFIPKYFIWEDEIPARGNNQVEVKLCVNSIALLQCCPTRRGSFLLLQFFHAKQAAEET